MVLLVVLVSAGMAALAHTAPFPFLLEYFQPGHSVWHMPRAGGAPAVYLTYDDGPNPDATPRLLDVLEQAGAKATFFVIPKHVTPETAPILARTHAAGHAIALHSGTRALMIRTPHELAAELGAQADRIRDLTGASPCPLFRPHAGWRSGSMYAGLRRAGYRLAGWSFGMWDWSWWRRPDPDRLAARLAGTASDGDIIVMHDGHHENPRADRLATVAATAELIPRLKARGFAFGTLCGGVSTDGGA